MGTESDLHDAGDSGSGAGTVVTVHIRHFHSKFSVKTSLDATVRAFKAVVAGSCEVLAEQQRLIFNGRFLKDDRTLQSYGLQADHTIHLVCRAAPPSSSTETASSNTADGLDNYPNLVRSSGLNEAGGSGGDGGGGDLFPELDLNRLHNRGVSGLFGVGLPEEVRQQIIQNPNFMRDATNAHQNIMNNFVRVRSLTMTSPQRRSIMDRNPDIAHVINDPIIPHEMMRNADMPMSNTESSAEGFNTVGHLHQTVDEPFLNGTARDTGSDLVSNSLAGRQGNQGVEARDQSSSPSTTGSDITNSSAPNTNPLPNPWRTAGGRQTNSAITHSVRTGNARASPIRGLGRLLLDERMIGGWLDSSQFNQVMQSPSITRMTRRRLSNSPYMNQHQQVLSQQRSLLSQHQRQRPAQRLDQTGRGAGASNNREILSLINMFRGPMVLDISDDVVPPEELYATQLSQLQEMGFFDAQENIRALIATAGSVQAAVEYLLQNSDQ